MLTFPLPAPDDNRALSREWGLPYHEPENETAYLIEIGLKAALDEAGEEDASEDVDHMRGPHIVVADRDGGVLPNVPYEGASGSYAQVAASLAWAKMNCEGILERFRRQRKERGARAVRKPVADTIWD